MYSCRAQKVFFFCAILKGVYQQTKQELFEKYGATGHTEENAKELLQKFGENKLEEKGKKNIIKVFLEQFTAVKPLSI